jgi:hypothetical protein
MPGFLIKGLKNTTSGYGRHQAQGDAEYYYTYTWEIFRMFKDVLDSSNKQLIHLRDCTLPTFEAQQDTYVATNVEYKWAKAVSWNDIRVSWYDTYGLAPIIRKWRDSIWSAEEGLQVASRYKHESQIDVFLPTGLSTVSWILYGSWPRVIRHGELTYTNSDVKLIEVTVAYDWADDKRPVTQEEGIQRTGWPHQFQVARTSSGTTPGGTEVRATSASTRTLGSVSLASSIRAQEPSFMYGD